MEKQSKKYYTKIQRSEDLLITLPEGWSEEGEKVSIEVLENDTIMISKFIEVEIDLDDNSFLYIAKKAHEKDITFNQMVCEIIKERIDEKSILNNDKS